MGYLAIEIIALLSGAAVLGFIVGWAVFGLGKKKVAAAPTIGLTMTNPKLEADYKAAVEARKKAETRVLELEAKEANFTDRLHERDAKVAELSHQLDDLAKIRVEAAAERSQRDLKDQRIATLEAQLRQRDADVAALAAAGGSAGAGSELQGQLAERDRQIAALKADVERLSAATSSDAPKVSELQAEIAELRAMLMTTAAAAPAASPDKDAVIGRLNEEVTGLRRAYEAAEHSLEEQDAAIDKLTRDLVIAQQRLAHFEGREVSSPPRSGNTGVQPRPQTAPQASAPAVAPAPPPAPAAPASKPLQVGSSESTVATAMAELVAKLGGEDTLAERPDEPRKPLLPVPGPTEQIDNAEKTVAVRLADLVSAVDFKRPEASALAKPPAPPPAKVIAEEDERTTAVALSDLVSQIDAAPSSAAPTPASLQVEANERTMALDISSMVSAVDGPPGPPPMQVEASESTVAISLSDLVGQIDRPQPPGPPPTAQVDADERTMAFVVPDSLLDDGPVADGDDLKQIKGIGPATEKRLNSAGITRWSQVASLSDGDLPAIADLLKVPVDKIKPWVDQAKALRQS